MKNMKQALLVAGCLLATTTLFAQTEKGDWAQFGRYAEANKTVKVPSNVGTPLQTDGGRRIRLSLSGITS